MKLGVKHIKGDVVGMENSKNLNAAVPLDANARSEAVRHHRRQEQPQNTLSPWDLAYTVDMVITCLISRLAKQLKT